MGQEARARVDILAPYSMFNILHVNQLYIIFRARLKNLEFSPGPESQEVRLFAEKDIPWDDLAFETVRHTLRFFFRDRKGGPFPMRTGTVTQKGNGFRFEAGTDDQLKIP